MRVLRRRRRRRRFDWVCLRLDHDGPLSLGCETVRS
jgi:hypothetical protein